MLYNSAGLPVAAYFFAMDGEECLGESWPGGCGDLALLSFCGKRWIGILTINDIKAKVPTAVESCGAAYSWVYFLATAVIRNQSGRRCFAIIGLWVSILENRGHKITGLCQTRALS